MKRKLAAIGLLALTAVSLSTAEAQKIIEYRPLDQSLFKNVRVPSRNFGETESIPPIIVDFLENPPTSSQLPKIIIKVINPSPKVLPKPKLTSKWLFDGNISWYGPGFYGHRTACGYTYSKTILGVAHKTLPCGTLVTFKYKSKIITVPVIDRGPYVAGRQFDLSGGLCLALNHCFTGTIYYYIH